MLPLDRFDRVHDPIRARVLVCQNGTDVIVLTVIDLTSIGKSTVRRLKAALARAAGTVTEQVVVVASHTFSAPHVSPTPAHVEGDRSSLFEEHIESAVLAAAASALERLRPVQWKSATGGLAISVCRDVWTPDGWGLGADTSTASSQPLPVVAAVDSEDRIVAVMFAADVQPSILDGIVDLEGNRVVSSDLFGRAADCIEEALPDAVAFALPGAAGDRSPVLVGNAPIRTKDGRWARQSIGDGAFVLLDLLGRRVADAVVEVTLQLSTSPGRDALHLHRFTLQVPGQVALPRERAFPRTAYEFTPTELEDIPVVILVLGELAFVGVQPELNAMTGDQIRRGSPFKDTLVATMVDGAAKYLPDAGSFTRITYAALSSRYARGAAETLVSEIVAELSNLWDDPANAPTRVAPLRADSSTATNDRAL